MAFLKSLKLLNTRTSDTLAQSLEVADHFGSRFLGLQGRRDLEPGRGLLLVPCRSVHTFFMRFPLDLLMLSRYGTVVGVFRGVPPWRTVMADSQTHAVLEVKGGTLPQVLLGDQIRMIPQEGKRPPHFPLCLDFLLNP